MSRIAIAGAGEEDLRKGRDQIEFLHGEPSPTCPTNGRNRGRRYSRRRQAA